MRITSENERGKSAVKSIKKTGLVGVLLGLLSGCTTVATPTAPVTSSIGPLQAWTLVLQEFVNDEGQVDFQRLKRRPENLHIYVNYIATTDPLKDNATFPTADSRLAHYINAYNAMAMYGVIQAGIPQTNAGAAKVNFFYLKRYEIGGKVQSLYAYEETIRQLGDPRVHFVLNCMSVSCPVLPRAPFSSDNLQAVLDAKAREFFADPRNLEIDNANRTVRVSEILSFYEAEFKAAAGDLVSFINRYAVEPVPMDYTVQFIPYDWTINQIPAGSKL